MRTTVTLEDDVLKHLRKLMRSEDKTFKDAMNEALRRGLRSHGRQSPRRKFRVKPHHSPFRSGIDPGKLNQLADQFDTETRIRKLHDNRQLESE